MRSRCHIRTAHLVWRSGHFGGENHEPSRTHRTSGSTWGQRTKSDSCPGAFEVPTNVKGLALRNLLAIVAVLAVSGAWASAASAQCSRVAHVKSGSVKNIYQASPGATGHTQLSGPDNKRLIAKGFYAAISSASISYLGVTFTVTNHTVFQLSCWGEHVGQPASHPDLSLTMGTVTVQDRAGSPGAVVADEGLVGTYSVPSPAQRFTMTRTVRGQVSFQHFLDYGPSVAMLGTVHARKLAGPGYLNFTPYLGSRPGTCRQGAGYIATSNVFNRATGKFSGSATFSGLAPFSVR